MVPNATMAKETTVNRVSVGYIGGSLVLSRSMSMQVTLLP